MTDQQDQRDPERGADSLTLEQRFAALLQRFWRPLRQPSGDQDQAPPSSTETNR